MPQPALNGDVIHRFLRFRGGAFLLLAAFVVQRQGHHFLFARRRRQVFCIRVALMSASVFSCSCQAITLRRVPL